MNTLNAPQNINHSHSVVNNITLDKIKLSCGGCQIPACNCPRFVVKDSNNAQFCLSCGHSRSKHG